MRISDWISECSSDLGARHADARCDGHRARADARRHRAGQARRDRTGDRARAVVALPDRPRARRCRTARRHPLEPCMIARSFALSLSKGVLDFPRSEEYTSELQSLMRISYAVFCLKNTQVSSAASPTTPSLPWA